MAGCLIAINLHQSFNNQTVKHPNEPTIIADSCDDRLVSAAKGRSISQDWEAINFGNYRISWASTNRAGIVRRYSFPINVVDYGHTFHWAQSDLFRNWRN
jgi:hypothetical protein